MKASYTKGAVADARRGGDRRPDLFPLLILSKAPVDLGAVDRPVQLPHAAVAAAPRGPVELKKLVGRLVRDLALVPITAFLIHPFVASLPLRADTDAKLAGPSFIQRQMEDELASVSPSASSARGGCSSPVSASAPTCGATTSKTSRARSPEPAHRRHGAGVRAVHRVRLRSAAGVPRAADRGPRPPARADARLRHTDVHPRPRRRDVHERVDRRRQARLRADRRARDVDRPRRLSSASC